LILETKQIWAPSVIIVSSMSEKSQRSHISRNQRKILEILEEYEELTAKDIAEILWARDIHYNTPEYSSAHRSLTTLCKRGLVEKIGGQLKWRRRKQ
jgi:DNA-binding MarR family transcriptional regulator